MAVGEGRPAGCAGGQERGTAASAVSRPRRTVRQCCRVRAAVLMAELPALGYLNGREIAALAGAFAAVLDADVAPGPPGHRLGGPPPAIMSWAESDLCNLLLLHTLSMQ